MRYRPVWEQLHSAAEAQERIRRILGATGEGGHGELLTLERFLPEVATETDDKGTPLQAPLLRASAWATTFSASLELAKQGEVEIVHAEAFAELYVSRGTAGAGPAGAFRVHGW